MISRDCPERDRLREVYRLMVDEWLAEVERPHGSGARTHELRSAVDTAFKTLLEHKEKHEC